MSPLGCLAGHRLCCSGQAARRHTLGTDPASRISHTFTYAHPYCALQLMRKPIQDVQVHIYRSLHNGSSDGASAHLVVAVEASARPGAHSKCQAEQRHNDGSRHCARRMRSTVRREQRAGNHAHGRARKCHSLRSVVTSSSNGCSHVCPQSRLPPPCSRLGVQHVTGPQSN